jgi:hypothetical protein
LRSVPAPDAILAVRGATHGDNPGLRRGTSIAPGMRAGRHEMSSVTTHPARGDVETAPSRAMPTVQPNPITKPCRSFLPIRRILCPIDSDFSRAAVNRAVAVLVVCGGPGERK